MVRTEPCRHYDIRRRTVQPRYHSPFHPTPAERPKVSCVRKRKTGNVVYRDRVHSALALLQIAVERLLTDLHQETMGRARTRSRHLPEILSSAQPRSKEECFPGFGNAAHPGGGYFQSVQHHRTDPDRHAQPAHSPRRHRNLLGNRRFESQLPDADSVLPPGQRPQHKRARPVGPAAEHHPLRRIEQLHPRASHGRARVTLTDTPTHHDPRGILSPRRPRER